MFGYNAIRNGKRQDAIYKDRMQRFESFKNWPQSHKLNPQDLVDNGFFYTGYKDKVRCFECGVEFVHWEFLSEDIAAEHQRWSGRCAFLNKLPYGTKFITNTPKPTCIVCCDKPTEIVFLPCGHAGVCTSCSYTFTKCIFCREAIKGKNKLYLM